MADEEPLARVETVAFSGSRLSLEQALYALIVGAGAGILTHAILVAESGYDRHILTTLLLSVAALAALWSGVRAIRVSGSEVRFYRDRLVYDRPALFGGATDPVEVPYEDVHVAVIQTSAGWIGSRTVTCHLFRSSGDVVALRHLAVSEATERILESRVPRPESRFEVTESGQQRVTDQRSVWRYWSNPASLPESAVVGRRTFEHRTGIGLGGGSGESTGSGLLSLDFETASRPSDRNGPEPTDGLDEVGTAFAAGYEHDNTVDGTGYRRKVQNERK